MSSEFFAENAAAIIGVGGTILGTIVGWLLNSLSQFGFLHFYDKSWKGYMFRPDGAGGSGLANSVDEAERYEFTTTVAIYNAGKNPKMMRNVEIAFHKGRKEIITFPRKNDPSRYVKDDELAPMNIPAQTGVYKKFKHTAFSIGGKNEIGDILKADRVFLTYHGKHGWKHKILLHKENFSQYFETHKPEGKNNG